MVCLTSDGFGIYWYVAFLEFSGRGLPTVLGRVGLYFVRFYLPDIFCITLFGN